MSQFGGVKLVKEVHLETGRDDLIEGIDLLTAAVGSTLGAGGSCVVLENDFGGAHITKDGVTVAENIQVQHPVKNLGITILKQAAKQTAAKAGDGTTTSTVLAHALIHSYLSSEYAHKYSFRDIRSGIEQSLSYLIKSLKHRSVKIDEKRLKSVSVISANGDTALGEVIAKAFTLAGENGMVTHQSSATSDTYVENVEGTHLSSSPASHHFFTNPEREVCELENPLVFLCSSEIPNMRRIQDILEFAIKQNRAILLIAELESQPLTGLAMNKVKGNIKCNVIAPPSFGLKRKDILDDIALLTGATVVNEDLGDALDLIGPEVLGSAAKAISTQEGTTLTFDTSPKELAERIDYLKNVLHEEENQLLAQHLEKRLALLTGGVAIINVGAETEVELKEKEDRVDDAVQAVRAAKKEGILPGGGMALDYIARNYRFDGTPGEIEGARIFFEALSAPSHTILSNAGLSPTPSVKKWGIGIDVRDGKEKDLRRAGIIDPTLVVIEAVKNATSVALTILSTQAVVSNVREK